MKTLKLLACSSLLVLSSSLCFGQSWLWGKQGELPLKTNDYASPVATDKNGNAYITGQYLSTVIFGNDTLNNINDNAYLAKYNAVGDVIWARQIIDSTGQSFGTSVATDESGNIYITGYFSSNAYMGLFSLMDSYHYPDVFLVKYNTTGTVLWAKQSITPSNANHSYAEGYSVATDKMGNVFITGNFIDTISFGSFTLNTIYRTSDAFLVKYNSSGNVLWVKQSQTPSISSTGYGSSVATDNYGNVYLTGYFQDTISFGAISLISPGISGFLVKYSPSGNVLWVKQSTNGDYCAPKSVITDNANNPYITGDFYDTVNFGSHILYSPSESVFLTKYDTNGNPIWAKESSPEWEGTGLAVDANKHIYMAGITSSYPDSLKFGSYVLYANPGPGNASFLMKFDTAGNPTCGSILNNVGSGALNGVASDSSGTYVYTASVLYDCTIICGPDTLVSIGGGGNPFVGRWQNCAEDAGVSELRTKSEELIAYPNPSSSRFTIQSSVVSGQLSVEVYNMLGEKVYSQSNIQNSTFKIDLSSNPNGIYLYRVISETGQLIGDGKLIIQK